LSLSQIGWPFSALVIPQPKNDPLRLASLACHGNPSISLRYIEATDEATSGLSDDQLRLAGLACHGNPSISLRYIEATDEATDEATSGLSDDQDPIFRYRNG
jgi:hypothetical protein